MQGELDALLVAGDGASPAFLRQLGVGDAHLLCGVTQSDPPTSSPRSSPISSARAGRWHGWRDPHYFGDDHSFARDLINRRLSAKQSDDSQ